MRANTPWSRNLKLLDWTSLDKWTLDQATQGVLISGATGSGKSSGPFQTIIRSFLRSGFGGIFLAAKPDATNEYLQLTRSENRENDVILFGPDTPNQRFNFLTYEAQQCGTSKAIVENIVLLLMQAAEIASRKNGGSHDPFFDSAMKALLRHCLFVVITATDKVDLELVLQIVQTLPQNLNDVEEPERLRSMQLLAEAERRAAADRKHELEMARRYFLWEWPTLADRTRSSIAITLSVLLDAFLRYPLRDMFLSELTVSPSDVLARKIIIIDVPVKTFDLIGKIAGVLWKYSLQRAIERRPELTNGHPVETIRPIFIAADECQFWTTSTDTYFQMTARSARGISVYSTQSIPNFYSEMGGDGTARARVDSLLANLQTRIACQNLDTTTNQWHSDSIGKIIIKRHSHSITTNNVGDIVRDYRDLSGRSCSSGSYPLWSQKRWLRPPTIPSNLVRVLVDADLWHFGVLTSSMHMAWLRQIGGRLKSDYRYSVGIVYNAFPWPEANELQKSKIRDLAQMILNARAAFPESSLADLYDIDSMPPQLRKAHRALDEAVDKLYRGAQFLGDRDRVENLFGLYEKLVTPLIAGTAPRRGKRAKK